MKISIKKAIPKKPPIGKYFKKSRLDSLIFISNIITTNKNKTAMAPTYTTIKISEINSTSNKSSKPAAAIKVNIKNRTEWTGLLTLITIIDENKIRKVNKINKDNSNIFF
jgi:ribosome maturation protein Sdo1